MAVFTNQTLNGEKANPGISRLLPGRPVGSAEMLFCFGQTQFSALIPGMRTNSRMLLVTMINPSLRA
jgi:hypothetical protein